MKVKDICTYLENWAPSRLQESYDNSGLLIGNPDQEVTGVVVCLDSTEEVLDEAIEKGANVIVAHHPIIFSGLKRITGKNYIERVVIKAIKHDLALYAIHTNLDNVFDGVNARISDRLGLVDRSILSFKDREENVGSGMIGNLEKEMTETEFFEFLKDQMKVPMIRHTPLLGKNIKKVALCGGSGSFLLGKAIRQKADVFVTGDFKYHQFFDADSKIVIADIGHYESEQFTIDLLAEQLKENFSTFAVYLSKVNTNPVNYY